MLKEKWQDTSKMKKAYRKQEKISAENIMYKDNGWDIGR